MTANEIIGWVGAGLLTAGYSLLSTKRLHSESPWFQVLNVGGAAGLAINGYWNAAFPCMVLNLVWVTIGTATLIRILRAKSKSAEGLA